MQVALTGHIDRSEWRWVTGVSVCFLLLLFSPLIILAIINPPSADWQFLGALHDHPDAAASLSRMQQGVDGDLLVQFMHSSEAHNALLIHSIYPLLGQLSRYTLQSPIVIFHIVRLIAAFFMFLSIYQLGATIWMKTRPRRTFFVIAVMGSGFGWLYALVWGFRGNSLIADLSIPQLYPLFSAGVNIHYPIAIACIALLVSVIIRIFRPGGLVDPNIENGGAIAFLSSMSLVFVYPDALLPLNIAYFISMLLHWGLRRKIFVEELRWWLWIIVPALPVVSYNVIITVNNDFVQTWLMQRGDLTPTPILLLVGVAVPLALGLPSLWRAIRRFEADGDRFMILWLLSMVICAYLPLVINQYFLLGIMLPLAYFATRSIEEFWLPLVRRRYRSAFYVFGVIALLPGHVLWLFLPVIPILEGWSNVSGNVLEQGYVASFNWLEDQTTSRDVILGSPEAGLWIPYWVQARPVYGHADETLNSETKYDEVTAWYAATAADDPICSNVIETYSVQFVLDGPRERLYGNSACLDALTRVATFGGVDIYATNLARFLQ